jgi:hypothetical protein
MPELKAVTMAYGPRRFNGLPGFLHVLVEIENRAQFFATA